MTAADELVTAHVTALGRELRGPVRMRRSMLAETRDGLRDASAALRDAGMSDAQAAERAVREFGGVAEVAPEYQAELTAAQGRRTALLVVVMFPALLIGWDMLWTHGVAWGTSGPPPALVLTLARLQDVVSGVVTVLALTVLIATLRRRAAPRALAAGAAVTGLSGAALCGGAAVTMNIANGDATAQMLATNPVALPSFALSGAALLLVLISTVRALRVARS